MRGGGGQNCSIMGYGDFVNGNSCWNSWRGIITREGTKKEGS